MQNRIDKLFEEKRGNILSIFITAGYPKLNDTLELVKALSKADMIEIGIPFSDPLADGETIQQSSQQALANGMNLSLLFEQLKGLRAITEKPVLLMGYLNSVINYGIEKFYGDCQATGIDGVILPDLPLQEYISEHKQYAEMYNVHAVFLISPATSAERIQQIDALSKGFVYLVSSNSTTGQTAIGFEQIGALVSSLNLKNPLLIGFGIKDAQTFKAVTQIANGAIIGSEYLRRIKDSGNFASDTEKFINEIKLQKHDYSINQ
jgi:tryptophan synthase alpha chain